MKIKNVAPPLAAALLTAQSLFAGAASASAPHGLEDSNPVADPAAVVVAGNARFTILTSALIRMEWSESGLFEDRPTYAFINRHLPVPPFSAWHDDRGLLSIRTSDLLLTYDPSAGRFDEGNLAITLTCNGEQVTWKPGTDDSGNLFGTVRTLDQVSGPTPLPPGLLSRDGWSVVDDSGAWVFDESKWPWAVARSDTDASDLYFFGYGQDYKRALKDFTRVAGRIPLPPRYALGTWWSRYWAYSDEELRQLVREYRENEVPLDVLVVDMDWHLDGWTGYTWNPEYFPDPEGFLKWVHKQGLRTTLNLHPHSGVGNHEKAFPKVAKAMGLDPEETESIPFQVIDRTYIKAYFKYLHHPLEKMGVDFWWMDWQQGEDSGLEGLDPLTWLNYAHWTDWQRNKARKGTRPLIFSRWGGLGNHRYQIGFSGDTYCNWESLAFQPYFTSTAGNVGYAWWSHDIGGHQPGEVEPELYARWIQFGALSPALRTHTTKNPEAERRIWAFDDEIFSVALDAFRLRYALAPYIYTAGRQTHDEGLPLLRPLYYHWPQIEEAYDHTGQYLFGDDLLVAPVVEPVDTATGLAAVDVWFPPGDWTNWFTGETFTGPSTEKLSVALDEIPLFVRGGAVIPTIPERNRLGNEPFDEMHFNIFPGTSLSGSGVLYEDDSISDEYKDGHFAVTPVAWQADGNGVRVSIGATQGDYKGRPSKRTVRLIMHDVWPAEKILVNGEKHGKKLWSYDPERYELSILLEDLRAKEDAEIAIHFAEVCGDRGVLTQGARGRRRHWTDISQAHGMATKDAPQAGQALRSATHAMMTPSWIEERLVELQSAAVSPDAVLRAAARLASLYLQTELLPQSAPRRGFAVHSRLGVREDVSGLKVDVSYEVSEGWSASGGRSRGLPVTRDQPVDLEAFLTPPQGDLAPGRIGVRYNLSFGGRSCVTERMVNILPSIPGWQVIGPFDNPDGYALDEVFGPEKSVDLSARYEGKDGETLAWNESVPAADDPSGWSEDFVVDLQLAFGTRHNDAVAYAAAWVESDREQDAVLVLGSDDGVAVWLNGEEIHRNEIGRAYTPRQDLIPVHLQKGSNELLLKISQGEGAWEFCASLETSDGEILRGVDYRVRP